MKKKANVTFLPWSLSCKLLIAEYGKENSKHTDKGDYKEYYQDEDPQRNDIPIKAVKICVKV